jgi:GT2 family glycosyltransferase
MIDLCVTNHNSANYLEKLLGKLNSDLDVKNKPWKLYLTDNKSAFNMKRWIRGKIQQYNIERIFFKENNGYAISSNYMASKGTSDIIGLLHSDVELNTSDIIDIQKRFDSNPNIHILGPKQRNDDGVILNAGIFGTNMNPIHRGYMEMDKNDTKYRDIHECLNVPSSAYFIRRSVWNVLKNHPKYKKLYPNAIGAFLETPHFYEEVWCSYFARSLGYKVFYDGTISIKHHGRTSTGIPADHPESRENSLYPISERIFLYTCKNVGVTL